MQGIQALRILSQCLYTYCGEYFDKETGTYYLRARYYDPAIGRFTQQDSVLYTTRKLANDYECVDPLSLNLYTYCANNPVLYCDPSGNRYEFSSALSRFAILSLLGKDPLRKQMYLVNTCAQTLGIDLAAFGARMLDMYESTSGVYHARTDCWQQHFGYNDLYDKVFDLGTSMGVKKFKFTHDDVPYIIWLWKGDYLNLGAGAELGIYYGGGPHWKAATSDAMNMTLSLVYDGKTIISHSQTTWWITGFNSNCLGIDAEKLTAIYTIYFSDADMYEDFYEVATIYGGWIFNSEDLSATFNF